MASGVASVLWGLWKIRNKACFQHVYPADPNSLVIVISQLLFSWSILQRKKLGKNPLLRSQVAAGSGV